jgi:hypothetical protein
VLTAVICETVDCERFISTAPADPALATGAPLDDRRGARGLPADVLLHERLALVPRGGRDGGDGGPCLCLAGGLASRNLAAISVPVFDGVGTERSRRLLAPSAAALADPADNGHRPRMDCALVTGAGGGVGGVATADGRARSPIRHLRSERTQRLSAVIVAVDERPINTAGESTSAARPSDPHCLSGQSTRFGLTGHLRGRETST